MQKYPDQTLEECSVGMWISGEYVQLLADDVFHENEELNKAYAEEDGQEVLDEFYSMHCRKSNFPMIMHDAKEMMFALKAASRFVNP